LSGEEGGSEDVQPSLGWRDYLAIFVALLQTVALPLVIMIIALLAILAVSALLR